MKDGLPGALLVFTANRALIIPIPLENDELVLGRDALARHRVVDNLISRRHARVSRRDSRWSIEDLGSRNGTFLDGQPLPRGGALRPSECLVRLGQTLLLLRDDVSPFLSMTLLTRRSFAATPALDRVLTQVAGLAASRQPLHLGGEPGSEKQLLARRFHNCRQVRGSFVPLDCAVTRSIPWELFEQRRFDGTLFLDNVETLALAEQTLLASRLKEAAASHSICTASARDDLRERAAAGTFAAELLAAVEAVTVRLPPLRERREDIPLLIENLTTTTLPHFSFVEAALLHPWPRNFLELQSVVRTAETFARANHSPVLFAQHLEAGGARC